MLRQALEALLSQQVDGVSFEIIIVDNNSTDDTREVVESLIKQGKPNLQYVFEPKQGISYGRNMGIAKARGQILAFTDDDVCVATDWVATIKRVFDQHPETNFIGGKIVPKWRSSPPDWLTRDHWWPLALLDYGNQPFSVNADNPLCLPTANAAFRHNVFTQIGLFSPDFSGREDHELLVRLWRAGFQGLYIPSLLATADVQPERLEKHYHHKWNRITGKFNSRMRMDELMGPQGGLRKEQDDMILLFGTPVSLYRDLLLAAVKWLLAMAQRRESLALQHENRIWYLSGYISERYRTYGAPQGPQILIEIASFVKNLFRKKLLSRGRKTNQMEKAR
jgi:cellulose synthase/poly-beta-1,6-N-acetylglucosamine synthase-like glycosyltransferase